MKKLAALLSLYLLFTLTACGPAGSVTEESPEPTTTEIMVFAASMQESLDAVIDIYQSETPDVKIIATYDSSGTLKTQIEEGAPCDLFISAAPKQVDALEDGGFLVEGTRLDLLENNVVLAVAGGNPANVQDFDQLADLLKNGDITGKRNFTDI